MAVDFEQVKKEIEEEKIKRAKELQNYLRNADEKEENVAGQNKLHKKEVINDKKAATFFGHNKRQNSIKKGPFKHS